MAYNSLWDFIRVLENQNELIRIKQFVDPSLEIAEITDRFSKQEGGGKALLFENTGTIFPVLTNSLGSKKRICLALGINNFDEPGDEIMNMLKQFSSANKNLWEKLGLLPALNKISSWMPKSVNGRGVCQEIIYKNPDLNLIPVLKCWPEDGGRFITLPMVHTIDPESGIRNVGMYRMQIFDSKSTGMHWHMHKTGARHYREYKKQNKKMPIAVTLGGDPVYTYSATAPLPDNLDEYILAGFLRKKRVKLVKCITQDIEVPEDVDFVIEGYVDPAEELIREGPFGDHTGFYSLADWYPKFNVTCITHRKNAVYSATIVGIPPQEDAWIGKITERIFLNPIKISVLPEIEDLDLPFAGVAHNLAIVKFNNAFPGHSLKLMNALWGAGQMMFNKYLLACDSSVDIHNYESVLVSVFNNVDFTKDIYFSSGPLDILDHSSSKYAFGNKMFIDATSKKHQTKEIPSIDFDYNSFNVLHDDVISFNKELLKKGLPIVFVAINKKSKDLPLIIAESIINTFIGEKLVVVFTEMNNLINDLFLLTWLCLGNTDPVKDIKVLKNQTGVIVVIDATQKKYIFDEFERVWPPIIVSDDKTILTVTDKWESLGLGTLIESPSLKIKSVINVNSDI